MTLPSLLTRALKSLTGSPTARYVFPLDRWLSNCPGQGDGSLLTLAHGRWLPGLVRPSCRSVQRFGFDARRRSSQAGRSGRRRRRNGLGVGWMRLSRPSSSALRTAQSVAADSRGNSCLLRLFAAPSKDGAAGELTFAPRCPRDRMRPWRAAIGGPLPAGPRTDPLQRILDGINAGLRTFLILVGRAAADANPTDVDFVRGHERQSAGKRDDSRNLGDARHCPPLRSLP